MRRERVAATACHWYGPAMTPQMNDDQFVTYVVILRNGPLSPAEDLETAIVAAAQAQALGQMVLRIEQDGQAILEGGALEGALVKRLIAAR